MGFENRQTLATIRAVILCTFQDWDSLSEIGLLICEVVGITKPPKVVVRLKGNILSKVTSTVYIKSQLSSLSHP